VERADPGALPAGMVGVGFSVRQAQDPEPVEGHTDAMSPMWKSATTCGGISDPGIL
jgi:hypothetical protein